MPSQKLENLLNLALAATAEEKEKSQEDMMTEWETLNTELESL